MKVERREKRNKEWHKEEEREKRFKVTIMRSL